MCIFSIIYMIMGHFANISPTHSTLGKNTCTLQGREGECGRLVEELMMQFLGTLHHHITYTRETDEEGLWRRSEKLMITASFHRAPCQ